MLSRDTSYIASVLFLRHEIKLRGSGNPPQGNSLVPMGQGAATAITPQGRRTPTGLPTLTTQPQPPPRAAPHYSTRHTEARTPGE